MESQKFSALEYANDIKRSQVVSIHASDHHLQGAAQGAASQDFEQLADDMRNFLASAKGMNEAERRELSETLNRAVLGFADDKESILAIIQDQLMKRRMHDLPSPNSKFQTMAEALFSEIIGLSVLELILKEREELEEIQVIGKRIFEVRRGLVKPSAYEFKSIKEVERIQQNLLLFNKDTMNPRKKWSEAMMKDGSRITLTGFGFTSDPTLTLRFYTVQHFDLNILTKPRYATMDDKIKALLLSLIRSYFNLVFIGATNTGKTSLMKACIGETPEWERIVTIESRLELMLKRDFPERNIIEYEVDDEDVVHSSKQAFKLALRQSPKRIIHAEIRDEDANMYVRACTRGHEGSMTSVHASSLEDVPDTICDMCMLDQRNMNPERLTKRIAEYVTQIGIHMDVVDDKRKVVRIVEYNYEGNHVIVKDIVKYDHKRKRWLFPGKLSQAASRRMLQFHPSGYDECLKYGLVQSC